MTHKCKIKMLTIVCIAFLLSALVCLGINVISTKTAVAANEVVEQDFYIDGAALRIDTQTDPDKDLNGIRFPIMLKKSYYDSNASNITKIGVKLTLDLPDNPSKDVDITDAMMTQIDSGTVVTPEGSTTEYYQAAVYIYNFDAEYYDCDITAQAYLMNEDTQLAETQDCTRSMEYVAMRAFDDQIEGINKYLPSYNITLDQKSGVSNVTLRYGEQIPASENVFFNGWYTEQSGGTKIDTVNADIIDGATVYAQYNAIAPKAQVSSIEKSTEQLYGNETYSYKTTSTEAQPQIYVAGNRDKPFETIPKTQKAEFYVYSTGGDDKISPANNTNIEWGRTVKDTWTKVTLTADDYNKLVSQEIGLYLSVWKSAGITYYISDFYISDVGVYKGDNYIDAVTQDTTIKYGQEAFSYKVDVGGQTTSVYTYGNRAKSGETLSSFLQSVTFYVYNTQAGVKVTLFNEYTANTGTTRFVRTTANEWVAFELTVDEYNALVTGENKIYFPYITSIAGNNQYFYISDFYISDVGVKAAEQIDTVTKDTTIKYGDDDFSYKIDVSGQQPKFYVSGNRANPGKTLSSFLQTAKFYIYTTNNNLKVQLSNNGDRHIRTVANTWKEFVLTADEYNALITGEITIYMPWLDNIAGDNQYFYISDFYIEDPGVAKGDNYIDAVTKDTTIKYGQETFSYKVDVGGNTTSVYTSGNRANPGVTIASDKKAIFYVYSVQNNVKVALTEGYTTTSNHTRTVSNTWVAFTLSADEYNSLVTGNNRIYFPYVTNTTGDNQFFYISDFYIVNA